MKKYKIAGLFLLTFLAASSCIEEGSDITGKGENRFRPSTSGGIASAVYDAVPGEVPLVDIWRDVVSSGDLGKAATVEFEVDNSILTAWNEANPSAAPFVPPSEEAVSVVGSSISYAPGDFTKPISIQLNPGALDLSKKNALGIRLKNPSSGYGVSQTAENGEFIVSIIVKNKWDGIYDYTGHIGRYDATSCELIELGGPVVSGVTATLATTGVNTVRTVLLWSTGSTIGGIGSSQTITIDASNNVTVTPNGASPANWGPIPGEPNRYDPETGYIYVSYKWSLPCSGAMFGFIRHVRVVLKPK